MPFGAAGMSAELGKLRKAFEERGRDSKDLHIVPMGIIPSDEKLSYFEKMGVSEAVLRIPAAGRDAVLPVLDDYAQYIDRF